MLASVQTGTLERTRIIDMENQFGNRRRLWITLAVLWTVMVILYGWMNLPRAPYMPHDPDYMNKLSVEAFSILLGNDARTEGKSTSARGALKWVWSESPRTALMSNGAELIFPAATTAEQVGLVASEYRDLLKVEATEQRVPYLLKLLAIWLAPLLVAGLAAGLISRETQHTLGWGNSARQ